MFSLPRSCLDQSLNMNSHARQNEVFLKLYAPATSKQTRMHIDIYSSPETDVWYTTGMRQKSSSTDLVDVQKVGKPIVSFSERSRRCPRESHRTKTREKYRCNVWFQPHWDSSKGIRSNHNEWSKSCPRFSLSLILERDVELLLKSYVAIIYILYITARVQLFLLHCCSNWLNGTLWNKQTHQFVWTQCLC